MRLFVAIELSPSARAHLQRVQDALRPLAGRTSFTKLENLHLTVKFLGEVPQQQVAELCEKLSSVPKPGEMDLAAGGLVCLPERGQVRILGAAITSPPQQLLRLQADVETAATFFGFPRENRAYLPHITLGRVRDPLPGSMRPKLIQATAGIFPGPPAHIGHFVLMESRLSNAGAEYTPLARFDINVP